MSGGNDESFFVKRVYLHDVEQPQDHGVPTALDVVHREEREARRRRPARARLAVDVVVHKGPHRVRRERLVQCRRDLAVHDRTGDNVLACPDEHDRRAALVDRVDRDLDRRVREGEDRSGGTRLWDFEPSSLNPCVYAPH